MSSCGALAAPASDRGKEAVPDFKNHGLEIVGWKELCDNTGASKLPSAYYYPLVAIMIMVIIMITFIQSTKGSLFSSMPWYTGVDGALHALFPALYNHGLCDQLLC